MVLGNFPDQFFWGVATAGHQSEGDNRDSDTWFLENVTPTIFVEPSGPACDGYRRWSEDLDLVAGMGLNAYRFSVEWARIEPAEGEFNEEALAHYEAIVDGCLERGLAPLVTFSHFTSPHWFAKRGAWIDAESSELFARFCGVVMDRFGDRIAAAVTFNEPNLPQMLAWAGLPDFITALTQETLDAASAAAGVEAYRAGNVMVPADFAGMQTGMTNAHLAAKAAIKQRRPELPVGLSIAISDDCAAEGGEAARDAKRADVYDHWLRLAREDDFIGVQNYERLWFGPDGQLPPAAGSIINEMGSAVDAASLGGAARYAHAVSGVPVFVTEHGASTPDDAVRAAFIEPSLAGLLEAISDGVPVLGYCHWTLMDNFEWVFGYGHQLGLHSVDRTTFERTAKPSAGVYGAIVAAQRAAVPARA
ncbi:glycoside hydrolase family 1 protein [Microterricola pindariensis]|uniref:Beta-glucosidase n=1 Tax=Microterricola pindariensis TaxID=478010 RepID=A0ABX5AX92_9MICO|nr:family 1 glycosylhydrolase [Microterricola pindariensis]PPL19154.1 beta-glucosidase [Microterricola pindariensis]